MKWVPDKLPEDFESEKALLASIVLAMGTKYETAETHGAILACRPEFFVKPQHRLVFESLLRLYSGKQEISPLFLKNDMEANGTADRAGGFDGIVEIMTAEEAENPMPLVTVLEGLYKRRRLIELSAMLCRDALGTQPVDEIISAQSAALTELTQGNSVVKTEAGTAIIERLRAREPFREPGSESGKLAWFGLPEFDKAIEAAAEHVVIVAARPGIGKSAEAVQIQWETAKNGIPSLLISLEMNRDEVHSRYAAWQSGYEQRAFRDGRYTDWVTNDLEAHSETLALMRFWAHPSGVPWPKVEAVIRENVRRHGVRVVQIDHLLLLQKPNFGKNVNDAACWTAISRNIKRLAQELKICFVNLCQLNRAGDGVEPKLSDLKETGGWEEDANAVILLYPKENKAKEQIHAVREVIAKAAKVRSGPSGWKRSLDFYGATSRFREFDYNKAPEPEPEAEMIFG
jgi:replicative DNA helicase